MSALLLAGVFLLAACQPTATPTPTFISPPVVVNRTPLASPYASTPTAGPTSARVTLRLWTSPEAAPGEQSPDGQVLARQLAAFEEANPGVTVEARVKQTSGVGGLLDFLRAASAAAPAALPDVVALNHDDLTTAAGEHLIQRLAPLIPPESLTDFYPLAVAAARVSDELYGLPFSTDATVLVYSTEVYTTSPQTWTDVISSTGDFLLPAGDPSGLVTLQQYRALGGAVTDDSGRPALNAGILEQVLAFYQAASLAGVLPASDVEYPDAAATWIAFRDHRAALAAAPATLYLRERDRAAATAATLLPTRDGTPLALGTGWSYALVTADPVRQPLALALMQWLTAPPNLGEWSQAAGALPTRVTALDAWTDDSLAAFARQVMSAAILQPDEAALAILGPPIALAVTDVLAGRASPQAAAERAAAAVAAR